MSHSFDWQVDLERYVDLRTVLLRIYQYFVLYYTGGRPVVAAYQWCRLHFVRAITYLLYHRIGNFVKGNKRNCHIKDWLNSLSVRQKVDSFPKPPTCQHRGISWGLQPIRQKIKCRNKHVQNAVLMFTYHKKE